MRNVNPDAKPRICGQQEISVRDPKNEQRSEQRTRTSMEAAMAKKGC
jgi:hypothetical protein